MGAIKMIKNKSIQDTKENTQKSAKQKRRPCKRSILYICPTPVKAELHLIKTHLELTEHKLFASKVLWRNAIKSELIYQDV